MYVSLMYPWVLKYVYTYNTSVALMSVQLDGYVQCRFFMYRFCNDTTAAVYGVTLLFLVGNVIVMHTASMKYTERFYTECY